MTTVKQLVDRPGRLSATSLTVNKEMRSVFISVMAGMRRRVPIEKHAALNPAIVAAINTAVKKRRW